MSSLRYALRTLQRDFRAGELTVLITAMVIAVTAMTAVAFFTDRVGRAVKAQASEVLAADLVIRSPTKIDAAILNQAEELGLETAQSLSFPTVVISGEQTSLAAVQAVSDRYPLRGRLLVSEKMFGPSEEVSTVPEPGTAWAEAGLLSRMEISTGDLITLGAQDFRITRVLQFKPDQSLSFINLAPGLMINLADIPTTKVVSPGSRVTWRQMFAGPEKRLEEFTRKIKPILQSDASIRGLEDAGDQINAAIDKAQRFLTLASLVTVILAAVATAMAARRYALRHLDTVALLKSIGASQAFVQQGMLAQLVLIVIGTTVVGTLIGYGAQFVLAEILVDTLDIVLPVAAPDSALLGFLTAVTIALGFAMPHLLALKSTAPMRVLRKDLPPPQLRSSVTYAIAVSALLIMVYIIVRDLTMLVLVSVGLMAMSLVATGIGLLLIKALTRFRGAAGVAWRYGLANISRRGRESVVQIVAFGLSLMVLLLLTVVRSDLLLDWQDSLPDDAPNYFLINIAPEQWQGIHELLDSELGIDPVFLPMIRGRITHIKGVAVAELKQTNPSSAGFARRAANLSWAAELPASNKITDGTWWGADYDGAMQVSFEQGVAGDLGISVGDTIGFNVGGEEFTAPVTSIRFVDWDSFQPNFYVMLSPGEVYELPQTYLSSLYIPQDRRDILNKMVREFPSVTVIDMEVILGQVRQVMDRASMAVQYVFLFTLLAGVTVLLAAIQITRDERRFESAILHTLGAKRSKILQGVAVEFIVLGGLAGVLAAIGATGVGWLLAEQVFQLEYSISPTLWLSGLLLGGAIVGITGTLATRKAVNEPPVVVLRDG